MTRDEMAQLLLHIHEEESQVRAAGQAEYAHKEDDAFANFRRVGDQVRTSCEHCGKSTRIGPMATLMVYFLKHVDGIVSYIGGHKSQREPVQGRIGDSRMYLALLRGLVETEESNPKSIAESLVDAKRTAKGTIEWESTTL